MGTNYYYYTDLRSKPLHVGKKSSGWTFHFRAHRGRPGLPDTVSIADWAQLFETISGTLQDEYERVIDDPLKFLAELERPTKAQQESEDSPERRGSLSPRPDPQVEWRDSEGFIFYDGEFC